MPTDGHQVPWSIDSGNRQSRTFHLEEKTKVPEWIAEQEQIGKPPGEGEIVAEGPEGNGHQPRTHSE